MKALTLHQPYATAIALGVKTVETRGWRTDYRGPLGIHAGARNPRREQVGEWTVFPAAAEWVENGEARMTTQPDVPGAPPVLLPLGVIVATCRLVDVVPITPIDGPTVGVQLDMIPGKVVKDRLLLWKSPLDPVDMTDQLPWGDFTPGRWAWLLDDVKPTTERCPACWRPDSTIDVPGYVTVSLAAADASIEALQAGTSHMVEKCATCQGAGSCDPVPARGRQGLWEWTP